MTTLDYKRGEVAILKQQLRDPQVEKDPKAKRVVLEKVIGYMTMGIDMAPLFAEMILATARETIVLKKIGYDAQPHPSHPCRFSSFMLTTPPATCTFRATQKRSPTSRFAP